MKWIDMANFGGYAPCWGNKKPDLWRGRRPTGWESECHGRSLFGVPLSPFLEMVGHSMVCVYIYIYTNCIYTIYIHHLHILNGYYPTIDDIYIYGSFEEFHTRNNPWNEVNNYADFSHTWAVARRAAIVVFRQDSRIHWYVAAASCMIKWSQNHMTLKFIPPIYGKVYCW